MGVNFTLQRLDQTLPELDPHCNGYYRDMLCGHFYDWLDGEKNAITIEECFRPRDFEKTRQWVRDHMDPDSENFRQMMAALDRMEADDAICIHAST